ncbi:MAG: SET domain-containing protein [Patescibacteria group bacterium]
MLLVKTKLGPSKIHGIGLFADEFIPKNTPIWKFSPGLDIKLTERELAKLPQNAQYFIQHYCYHSIVDKKYVILFDDARFFNHSSNPNVISMDIPDDPEGMEIALRDIQPSEELLCDCREFDTDCAEGKEEYTKG